MHTDADTLAHDLRQNAPRARRRTLDAAEIASAIAEHHAITSANPGASQRSSRSMNPSQYIGIAASTQTANTASFRRPSGPSIPLCAAPCRSREGIMQIQT